MAKADRSEVAIRPADCLAELPELALDTIDKEGDDGLRRAELRQSLLAVAELNHVTETALARGVVENALGSLPDFEE